MQKKIIELFTDGGCRGNPGMGAWGACLRLAGQEKVLWGFVPETTNNRMELTAALRGLEALKRPSVVRVVSDSRYLRDGMTQWLAGNAEAGGPRVGMRSKTRISGSRWRPWRHVTRSSGSG